MDLSVIILRYITLRISLVRDIMPKLSEGMEHYYEIFVVASEISLLRSLLYQHHGC